MRALTLDFDSRRLIERDVPDPEPPGPGELLLRIREAGVCGTDRELAKFAFGRPPEGSSYLVLGHEAVAEVVACGEGVSGWNPGDIAVPTIRRGCRPACTQCAKGRRDLCTTGGFTERGIFGAHGYFSEYAVDQASDLTRIAPESVPYAVLAEPLSVVEKAVSTALRIHVAEPRRALVIGAGTIGLLAAMVLRLRGLDVEVCSMEPPGSARARLVALTGAEYSNRPGREADIVIEAAGDPNAAMSGLESLAPLGVLMILGAERTSGPVSLLPLIVGNRTVAGSVNASPEAFGDAARDLASMPAGVLGRMIERLPFGEYLRSITGSPLEAPKIVHIIE